MEQMDRIGIDPLTAVLAVASLALWLGSDAELVRSGRESYSHLLGRWPVPVAVAGAYFVAHCTRHPAFLRWADPLAYVARRLAPHPM